MVDAIEQLARALHPEAFASRAVPPRDTMIATTNSKFEEACICIH
jgi:hypothetical protein